MPLPALSLCIGARSSRTPMLIGTSCAAASGTMLLDDAGSDQRYSCCASLCSPNRFDRSQDLALEIKRALSSAGHTVKPSATRANCHESVQVLTIACSIHRCIVQS